MYRNNLPGLAMVVLTAFFALHQGCTDLLDRPGDRSSIRSSVSKTGSIQPLSITLCRDMDTAFIAQTEFPARAGDKAVDVLYAINLETDERKEILRSRQIYTVVAAPIPHLYAVSTWEDDGDYLLLLHDDGTVQGKFSEPARRGVYFPTWTKDAKHIAFFSPEVDGQEGVSSEVGVFSVDALRVNRFPVAKTERYYGFGVFDNHIYVLDHSGARIYDVHGQMVGQKPGMKGAQFSAKGRYYLPHQGAEACVPFEIYETRTNTPLRKFGECGSSEISYPYHGDWNPADDDLIMLYREDKTESAWAAYSVSRGRAVKSFSDVDSPHTWSPDGSEIVFHRDGKVVLEPVGLEER